MWSVKIGVSVSAIVRFFSKQNENTYEGIKYDEIKKFHIRIEYETMSFEMVIFKKK